jgi:uncharacterized protein YijF (DUF1287 family)
MPDFRPLTLVFLLAAACSCLPAAQPPVLAPSRSWKQVPAAAAADSGRIVRQPQRPPQASPAPVAGARQAPRFAQRVLEGARDEVRRAVRYDAGYVRLPYPAGDVPADRGACTDLVVRAYRRAGVDLQKEIHEDRKANPRLYPPNPPGERSPNSDIDQRRCRNLVVWFRRHATELTASLAPGDLDQWRPGDVAFFHLARKIEGRPGHVGIVSDRKDRDGMPLVLDNLGPVAAERYRLDAFASVDSHFRYPLERAGEPIAPRYPQSTTSSGP